MPDWGSYGLHLPLLLTRFSAPEHCRVKYTRGTVIRWTCAAFKGVTRWRIVERAWNRNEKEWDYRVVPAS